MSLAEQQGPLTNQEMAKVLDKAVDLLIEKGHCKRALVDSEGRMCAYGALNMALNGDPYWGVGFETEIIGRKVIELNNEWIRNDHGDLADWNNQVERTADDVIAAFRLASTKLRMEPVSV